MSPRRSINDSYEELFTFALGDVESMAMDEKGKAEEMVNKAGEDVGKGPRKGWDVAKSAGKGLKKGLKGEEQKKQ